MWRTFWMAAVLAGVTALVRAEDAAPKERLMRETMDAAELVKSFPARIRDENKKVVYALAAPADAAHAGVVAVSRWKAMSLPADFATGDLAASSVPSFFVYEKPASGARAWHVNFADPSVFAFYGGPLFAQDEMQVAEHPALASVREMLIARKLPTETVEMAGPTPILVRGVQRRVRVATDANADAGRPGGLYGNRFGRASQDVVRKAVTVIDPPTVSNIIAMAAPRGGSGKYTRDQLEHVLKTAYTGFRAAKLESGESKVEIHTGLWGCGAFGGNRTVMIALQIAAARLAGADAIFIYTGDKAGEKDFVAGRAAYEKAAGGSVADFLNGIETAGYRWGTGDGN